MSVDWHRGPYPLMHMLDATVGCPTAGDQVRGMARGRPKIDALEIIVNYLRPGITKASGICGQSNNYRKCRHKNKPSMVARNPEQKCLRRIIH